MVATEQQIREQLILCKKIARVVSRNYPWLADEMESESLIGYAIAAQKYNPELGPWKQFASTNIWGKCIDVRRKQLINRKGHPRAFSALPDWSVELEDISCTFDEDRQIILELIERVERQKTLSVNEKKALKIARDYLDLETLKKVGEVNGLGESMICRYISKATELMRQYV